MKLGAVFPQSEFKGDAGAVREWTKAAEAMGYDHVTAYDHVVGANPASRPGWQGYYDIDSPFLDPFVLFAHMAAVTTKLSFASGVFILPQRQAVLFAKQAACVDVLSGGRLRLGVGTGWNAVEYEALGVPYEQRGDIFDEQIDVLRALWTQRAVTLKLPHHTITDAGLKPMPVQKPIPIWLGGGGMSLASNMRVSERVLKRIALKGDGWLPMCNPDDAGYEMLDRIHRFAREAGRDPATIGIEGRVDAHRANQDQWADTLKAWKRFGATYFLVDTLRDGLKTPEQHLRRLEEAIRTLKL